VPESDGNQWVLLNILYLLKFVALLFRDLILYKAYDWYKNTMIIILIKLYHIKNEKYDELNYNNGQIESVFSFAYNFIYLT